jgi:hypothetical protein
MANEVAIWWFLLCGAALLNVIAWGFSARLLTRRAADLPASTYTTRRLILWLAAAYVLGCGFRSILPMVDVPRICLHDTPFSRIVIGRTVATIAELCFAAQFALLLHEAGRAHRRAAIVFASAALMALIALAEVFSWSAVLSTNYLLHAIENSLWTLGAILGLAAFTGLYARVGAGGTRFLVAVLLSGLVYIAFMTWVDVPMYLTRWHAAAAAGHEPLSVQAGLREIMARCTVVREWSAWREDVPWLTLYFTSAVWISVALAHAPPLVPRQPVPGTKSGPVAAQALRLRTQRGRIGD